MKGQSTWPSGLRLQAEIVLWRYGWIWPLVICAALLVLFLKVAWGPHQQRSLRLADTEVTQLRIEQKRRLSGVVALAQPSTEELLLTQLAQTSYAESQLSDLLRQIAQLAKAKGLLIAQSEFQSSNEGHGGLRQQLVTLPVRASYPQLRQFVEELLLKFPGLSVDQLVLKRETVAQDRADVRLRLSLWINPGKSSEAVP